MAPVQHNPQEIRLASKKDAPELCRLLMAQMKEHDIDISAERLAAGVEGFLVRPDAGAFLVAENSSAGLVGVACLSCSWVIENGGFSAWLQELYVSPDARGRGTGEALLKAAIAEAERRGCAAIDLEIEHSHKRVESLYRRHGFREHTRTRWVRLSSSA